jgi:hypothetical protein
MGHDGNFWMECDARMTSIKMHTEALQGSFFRRKECIEPEKLLEEMWHKLQLLNTLQKNQNSALH